MSEQANDTKLQVLPENPPVYVANGEYFGIEAIKKMAQYPDKPTAIEDDIVINGISDPKCLVIIGFSTKKVLEAVKKFRGDNDNQKVIKYVLVIEPDPGRFHATIKREFVVDLFKEKNVDLVLGVDHENIAPYLFSIFTRTDEAGNYHAFCKSPEIVTDPFAYPDIDGKINPEAEKYVKAVIDASKQAFLALGCASDGHFRWENFWDNKENITSKYQIKSQFDKYQDMPAIVLGAGPSLDDFISAYKDYSIEDKALIIACDASLKKLLHHGIRPHFVTRCERKFTKIFDGVENHDLSQIYYVGYPWCAYQYFDLFPDSFMAFRENGICRWSTVKPGSIDGGVSSANAALELAILLGSKRIILSGIDLCFIDEKSHTDGTEVEFDINKSKPKWSKIMGNHGEEVTTIPIWYRCLNEYHASLLKHSDRGITVHNTSQRGAVIPLTLLTKWGDLKDAFGKRLYVRERIKKHLTKTPQEEKISFQKKIEDTLATFKLAVKDFEKCFIDIDDAFRTLFREEEKMMVQLKAPCSTYEFWASLKTARKTLKKEYLNICRIADSLRDKWYNNRIFADTIGDMCSYEIFDSENQTNSLLNDQDETHMKLRKYILINNSLYRTLYYYLNGVYRLMLGEFNGHSRSLSESFREIRPIARDGGPSG